MNNRVKKALSSQSDEDYRSTLSSKGNEDSNDLGELMCNFFEKQLFTDVTFFLNESSISAHRVVLAAKSSFFENLLYGEERYRTNGMQMNVKIADVSFSVFTNLLRYCYTNYIEFPDDPVVLEIYAAAQKFEVQQLLDKCKIYIEFMEVTEDNVCSLLQSCNTKHIEDLKSRCIRFLEKNTHQVVRSPSFEKISFTTLREICELERLSLTSEFELLEAVLRWLNFQPKHTKKELTKSLIKCIRFVSFSPREFGDVMRNIPDILTAEEGLNILMHLNNPTAESLKSLPRWCNKSQRSYVHYKEIPRDLSEGRRIQIALKAANGPQHIEELTSKLNLKCVQGMHDITSIHFSFEGSKNDGSLWAFLVMKIQILPKGPTFRKNYNVRSQESLFVFPKSVKVGRSQSVEIEVVAKICEGCRFLRFDRWHNDPKRDFQIFLRSIPKQGNLNFISEIEYKSLA